MPRSKMSKTRKGITLIDGVGLHNALAGYGRRAHAEIDAAGLVEAVEDVRERMELVASTTVYTYMSVNYESDRQMDSIAYLESHGIGVIAFDYKTTAVHTSRMKTKRGERIPMNNSVVPQISFALGMISAGPPMDILLIGQSFELDYPMRAARKEGHKVALAFWKPWLDRRYGLYSDIDFFDLENLPYILQGDVRTSPNPDESPYEATEVPVPVIPT